MGKGFEPIPFGRYLLTERIARGGMSEVFRAITPPALRSPEP
jgi:hypothetical protein